ncbi:Acyltransferase mlcH [Fusarium oxysporum f. sp. albedinis]|nr:Acyltransferase mlcH [Fusarium oxysporum f. sp. albedinis]
MFCSLVASDPRAGSMKRNEARRVIWSRSEKKIGRAEQTSLAYRHIQFNDMFLCGCSSGYIYQQATRCCSVSPVRGCSVYQSMHSSYVNAPFSGASYFTRSGFHTWRAWPIDEFRIYVPPRAYACLCLGVSSLAKLREKIVLDRGSETSRP